MMKKNSWLAKLFVILVMLFNYLPIIVVVVYSFNASKSRGTWGGFSLKWYAELFSNSDIMQALITTLTIAVISAAVSVVIGTAAAVGIYYSKRRTRALLTSVSNIPMLNADIVTGISLLLLFTFLHMDLGYLTILLAHITFNIPYVILSVMPKLRQLDKNAYEAAIDLGATPLRAFFSVIIPEISPGIVTGAILAFTMSIDDFVISFFTTGGGVSTLSIEIYTMAKRGIKPEINALSAIMFLLVMTLLIIVNVRSSNAEKKKER